jgi:hypothetical protein
MYQHQVVSDAVVMSWDARSISRENLFLVLLSMPWPRVNIETVDFAVTKRKAPGPGNRPTFLFDQPEKLQFIDFTIKKEKGETLAARGHSPCLTTNRTVFIPHVQHTCAFTASRAHTPDRPSRRPYHRLQTGPEDGPTTDSRRGQQTALPQSRCRNATRA